MRCRHNCFEITNQTTHFVLPAYNECSLNIMINTPSLFANKGAFSSCITDDSWCCTIKVIYSFSPFSWFFSRAVIWSENNFPPPDFFPLLFFLLLFFFLFFKSSFKSSWAKFPHVRKCLPTDQSGTLGDAELFQVTGTPFDELESTFTKQNSTSWRCLPLKMTRFSRGVIYSPCRGSQWSYLFQVCI